MPSKALPQEVALFVDQKFPNFKVDHFSLGHLRSISGVVYAVKLYDQEDYDLMIVLVKKDTMGRLSILGRTNQFGMPANHVPDPGFADGDLLIYCEGEGGSTIYTFSLSDGGLLLSRFEVTDVPRTDDEDWIYTIDARIKSGMRIDKFQSGKRVKTVRTKITPFPPLFLEGFPFMDEASPLYGLTIRLINEDFSEKNTGSR